MANVLLTDLWHLLFMFGTHETCSPRVLRRIMCASELGEQRGIMARGRGWGAAEEGPWCASMEASVGEDFECIFDENFKVEA